MQKPFCGRKREYPRKRKKANVAELQKARIMVQNYTREACSILIFILTTQGMFKEL